MNPLLQERNESLHIYMLLGLGISEQPPGIRAHASVMSSRMLGMIRTTYVQLV